jgi:hypothetical protein
LSQILFRCQSRVCQSQHRRKWSYFK